MCSLVEEKKSCEVHTLGTIHKSQSVACLNSPLAVHYWLDTAQLPAPANFSVSFSVCQVFTSGGFRSTNRNYQPLPWQATMHPD